MPGSGTTAINAGQAVAQAALRRHREALAARAAALAGYRRRIEIRVEVDGPDGTRLFAKRLSAGFLVALGDSWFDYPFHDVLERLDHQHGYDIADAAHRGDRVEQMAYAGGQIDEFLGCLDTVRAHGVEPRAILISGGGNDIVGDDFGLLLNQAGSPIAGWNESILTGIIDERVLTSYRSLVAALNFICLQELQHLLPIVVHGYDYLVPDGRGILFGPFPGPWLQPGFEDKGFPLLSDTTVRMRHIIERLHAMFVTLTTDGTFSNLHYLDLRNTLNHDLSGDAYKQSWSNELHPTKAGFGAIADRFATLLDTL